MKLYLAGNFTVTDEIENEKNLKKTLQGDYNRLCTFFYPKAADVIVQNIKPNIKKKIEIDEAGLITKNHPALQSQKGDKNNDQENQKEKSRKKHKKTIKIKRKQNTRKSL